MSLTSCPFCEHGNTEDAKFCNACGGALHLAPCPRCGAVSEVTATTCYQCQSVLPGRKSETNNSRPAAAEVSGSSNRRSSRAIAVTTFLAAIVVLGYFGYRQRPLIDAIQPEAASWDANGHGDSAGVMATRQGAALLNAAPFKEDSGVLTAHPVTLPRVTSHVASLHAATVESSTGRKIAGSREEKAAAASAGEPATIARNMVTQENAFRPIECTESIAALGLCRVDLVRNSVVAAPAAISESTGGSQATGTDKSGGRELTRQQMCTESIVALGLCAPTPTVRSE